MSNWGEKRMTVNSVMNLKNDRLKTKYTFKILVEVANSYHIEQISQRARMKRESGWKLLLRSRPRFFFFPFFFEKIEFEKGSRRHFAGRHFELVRFEANRVHVSSRNLKTRFPWERSLKRKEFSPPFACKNHLLSYKLHHASIKWTDCWMSHKC